MVEGGSGEGVEIRKNHSLFDLAGRVGMIR